MKSSIMGKYLLALFILVLAWIVSAAQVNGEVIPKTGWQLLYVDSQEAVGSNGLATNVFDNNSATIWHTKWYSSNPPLPHELQIDLGAFYVIDGFRYLPRQDGNPNGNIKQYEFYVSDDGINWDSPAAVGTFANTPAEKEVSFAAVLGRFIRLRALTEVNGMPWTSMAELTVLGNLSSGNLPPNSVINSPSNDLTIIVGETVNFAGSGVDTDNNLPLTYKWAFGAGSGIPDSTLETPGAVQFNIPGTYTVTFTATDALGLSDPSPAVRVITVVGGIVPKSNWQLLYVDSQETVGSDGRAVNGFDSNPATIWHTKWYGNNTPLPHEIQIDLGAFYAVDGFRYLPRQDGNPNGNIKQYEFYVSDDGINWGSPAAVGTFANTPAEKEVSFAAVLGKFIRLRALTEVNGMPWTSMAELTVLGNLSSGNLPPNSVINSPSNDLTIIVGETVNFAGSGVDTDNNLPLTYKWAFGAGSGIPDSTLETPGAVQFNIPGTYTVTFTATDALGLSDPSPAVRVITVVGGIVPKSNWQLLYVDSQETIGSNSLAVNGFDSNPATIWHTKWYSNNPPLPHELQIDLGAFYVIDGFRYLPRQDGSPNGNIRQYEFYVSDDGINWGSPAAAGTFANTTAEKEVSFAAMPGKFIRLRALTEVNGMPWTSMAELTALGSPFSGNHPPNGVIGHPSKDIAIHVGETVNFTGIGTDLDNNLPLTFHWNFGAGSGIPDSTAQDSGAVQFDTPGTYNITFTVTDALGLSDLTPATRTITVLSDPFEFIPNWTSVTVPPFNPQPAISITNPVLTASNVTDVPARFVADPFLFYENNTWYLFFEVFNNSSNKTEIAVATSGDGYSWQYKQIVMRELSSVSYPLVFKYNGKYYMTLECNWTNSVRLYESSNFPYEWHAAATLVTGKPFVDTAILWFNNVWWMFTSDLSNSNMYLYYSDNLLSGWVEHPKSPVVKGDSSKARGGGRPFVFDTDRIIRLTQKDNLVYGEQVRAFEVDTLTRTDYVEHEIPESPLLKASGIPGTWNAGGMHTLDCWWTVDKWLCITDGWSTSTNVDWSIGIYTAE